MIHENSIRLNFTLETFSNSTEMHQNLNNIPHFSLQKHVQKEAYSYIYPIFLYFLLCSQIYSSFLYVFNLHIYLQAYYICYYKKFTYQFISYYTTILIYFFKIRILKYLNKNK